MEEGGGDLLWMVAEAMRVAKGLATDDTRFDLIGAISTVYLDVHRFS